jgi:class 3 adenylate cyclase
MRLESTALATERVERRLAAILAADVAGYSRLMGADEEGTLVRLKAHRRELIDPKIAEHRGRIVKTTGDGILVEFASVVDAVRCAVEIQRYMIDRNAGMAEEKHIAIRVGVNLGDVIIDGDDIYGDGVNIAARLEALAEPGGSASRGWCATRSATSSPIRSRTRGNRASRTSHARCAPTRWVRLLWHRPPSSSRCRRNPSQHAAA